MNRLEMRKIDGVPVARVNEDIDAANVAGIQRRLAEALDPDALSLVVDLTATRYLDSAGIDMLLRLGNRLDQRRAKLILVIPAASPLRRLATIVGMPEAIAIHGSLADALQEAAEAQSQVALPSDSSREGPRGAHASAEQGSDDAQRAPYLTIAVRSGSDAQTIALIGEADLLNAPRVEAALEAARAADGPKLTILDLTGLTFIDSSGLHALVKAHQLHRTHGHELRIIPGPASVQRLFELTGLDDVLPFCDPASTP